MVGDSSTVVLLSDVPPYVKSSPREFASMPSWESFSAHMLESNKPLDELAGSLLDRRPPPPSLRRESPLTRRRSSSVELPPAPAPSASLPTLKLDPASDGESPAGESRGDPYSQKSALAVSAAKGRDASCARVGCPRCCYIACPCACHKSAANLAVSVGRGESEDWIDFDSVLTEVIAEAAELSVGEECAAAVAGVVPAMPPLSAFPLLRGGRGGETSPGNTDTGLKPRRTSRRKRRQVSPFGTRELLS